MQRHSGPEPLIGRQPGRHRARRRVGLRMLHSEPTLHPPSRRSSPERAQSVALSRGLLPPALACQLGLPVQKADDAFQRPPCRSLVRAEQRQATPHTDGARSGAAPFKLEQGDRASPRGLAVFARCRVSCCQMGLGYGEELCGVHTKSCALNL